VAGRAGRALPRGTIVRNKPNWPPGPDGTRPGGRGAWGFVQTNPIPAIMPIWRSASPGGQIVRNEPNFVRAPRNGRGRPGDPVGERWRETKPISARATRGASALRKRSYGKSYMQQASAKQSQFRASKIPHHSSVPSFQHSSLVPVVRNKPNSAGPILQNKPNFRYATWHGHPARGPESWARCPCHHDAGRSRHQLPGDLGQSCETKPIGPWKMSGEDAQPTKSRGAIVQNKPNFGPVRPTGWTWNRQLRAERGNPPPHAGHTRP